jgi:hypothetical protein
LCKKVIDTLTLPAYKILIEIEKQGIKKMATDLRSSMKRFEFTRFAGGKDRGQCLQVTEFTPGERVRFVHLTRDEARELAEHLLTFADGKEVAKR